MDQPSTLYSHIESQTRAKEGVPLKSEVCRQTPSGQPGVLSASLDLTVYIPTFGRPEKCLDQVRRLHYQRLALSSPACVNIIVAVNGDATYKEADLLAAGADQVILRPFNIGGRASNGNGNAVLGYLHLLSGDYLWILADDDPVIEGGLETVVRTLLETAPDLLLLTHSDKQVTVQRPSSLEDLDPFDPFVDLLSATIYSSCAVLELVDVAFSGVFTCYPHVTVIARAIEEGDAKRVALVPLRSVLDYSASLDAVQLHTRREAHKLGSHFFGGALVTDLSTSKARRRAQRRSWWRRHWHRVSMYGRSGGSAQQRAALGLALKDPTLWPLLAGSLVPWWRLKDVVRPRGDRNG